jgi:hypothetical protein
LLLQSNGFDTTWTSTNTSQTAAAGTAPDGTNTAWEIKDTVDGSAVNHLLGQTVSATAGVNYTVSVWAKQGTLPEVLLFWPAAIFGAAVNTRFNLATGDIISSGTGVTASIVSFSNGWYRVAGTLQSSATASGNFQIRLGNGTGGSYQGDGTGTIYLWGAQLEAGSFPTSYIPTTTATVTRSADVASISGSNFSSWYRQDEGTVFADSTVAATNNTRIAAISDNTTTNRIFLSRGSGSGGNINMTVTNTTVQVSALIFATALAAGTSNRVAAVYKASDFAGSVNGLTAVTQNTGTVPSAVTQLGIGTGEILGNNTMTGTIRRLTYWPQRLSNSTLQQITQ